MKTCSKCQLEKHETEFRIRKDRPCGLRSNCKTCDLAYEHTSAGQQACKSYRQSQNGKMHARIRMSKHQRTEKGKATVRKYKTSPKGRLVKIRRRDAEYMLDVTLAVQDIIWLYEIFKAQCFNCGSTKRLCIDHHKPLSKGFGLSLDNAVLLCDRCNSSKGHKMPEEFYSHEKLIVLAKLFQE